MTTGYHRQVLTDAVSKNNFVFRDPFPDWVMWIFSWTYQRICVFLLHWVNVISFSFLAKNSSCHAKSFISEIATFVFIAIPSVRWSSLIILREYVLFLGHVLEVSLLLDFVAFMAILLLWYERLELLLVETFVKLGLLLMALVLKAWVFILDFKHEWPVIGFWLVDFLRWHRLNLFDFTLIFTCFLI
jgi:hypothetical protein